MKKHSLFIYFVASAFLATQGYSDTTDSATPFDANPYPPGCIPTIGLPTGSEMSPCEAYFPPVMPAQMLTNNEAVAPETDTTSANTPAATETKPITYPKKSYRNYTSSRTQYVYVTPDSYYPDDYYNSYYPYYSNGPYYPYYPYYYYPNDYNYLGAFVAGLAFGALWNVAYYNNYNGYYWHGGGWNNYYHGYWNAPYTHGAYWNGGRYAGHWNAASHQNFIQRNNAAAFTAAAQRTNLQHVNHAATLNRAATTSAVHRANVNRNIQHHGYHANHAVRYHGAGHGNMRVHHATFHNGNFGGHPAAMRFHNAAFHGGSFGGHPAAMRFNGGGFHGGGFGGHGGGMRFHGGRH